MSRSIFLHVEMYNDAFCQHVYLSEVQVKRISIILLPWGFFFPVNNPLRIKERKAHV